MLGTHVIYHAHADHKAKTVRKIGEKTVEVEVEAGGKKTKVKKTIDDTVELVGSIHHPEMQVFAGLITRARGRDEKGVHKFDLIIFPPGRAPKHIDDVAQGAGDHQFEIVKT